MVAVGRVSTPLRSSALHGVLPRPRRGRKHLSLAYSGGLSVPHEYSMPRMYLGYPATVTCVPLVMGL